MCHMPHILDYLSVSSSTSACPLLGGGLLSTQELDDDALELELEDLEFLLRPLSLFSPGNLLDEGACS